MKKATKSKTSHNPLEYMAFPAADISETLLEAFVKMALKDRANGVDPTKGEGPKLLVTGDPSELTTELTLPVPLTKELLAAIEEIEDSMLRHGCAEDCEQCRKSTRSGMGVSCHGIFEKGDLVKCMMAGVLRIGFQQFIEHALSVMIRATGDKVKETTAAETFNPELRKMLH